MQPSHSFLPSLARSLATSLLFLLTASSSSCSPHRTTQRHWWPKLTPCASSLAYCNIRQVREVCHPRKRVLKPQCFPLCYLAPRSRSLPPGASNPNAAALPSLMARGHRPLRPTPTPLFSPILLSLVQVPTPLSPLPCSPALPLTSFSNLPPPFPPLLSSAVRRGPYTHAAFVCRSLNFMPLRTHLPFNCFLLSSPTFLPSSALGIKLQWYVVQPRIYAC
jgi:hypothetical protein